MDESIPFHEHLAAARRGEQEALDALCARFYPRVQAKVHQMLAADLRMKRPWIAAVFSTGDVVQEVFLEVLRSLPEFRGQSEGEFATYLTTMTRNRLIDAVRFHEAVQRDRRRVRDEADVQLAGKAEQPVDTMITRDELTRYAEALAGCSERERELVRARVEAADSPRGFRELAEQLGYPSEDAARKAFYACKARLLVRLGRKQ
jgi:RNA polymerase sigma factor (sigma-70 family)